MILLPGLGSPQLLCGSSLLSGLADWTELDIWGWAAPISGAVCTGSLYVSCSPRVWDNLAWQAIETGHLWDCPLRELRSLEDSSWVDSSDETWWQHLFNGEDSDSFLIVSREVECEDATIGCGETGGSVGCEHLSLKEEGKNNSVRKNDLVLGVVSRVDSRPDQWPV